jgi:hypothetical protein
MKFGVLLMSVLSLLAISITPAVAGPTGPNFAIPDGEWQGSLGAYYLWEMTGSAGIWSWNGDMHFFSEAGELTGDSAVTGTGSGETDAAMAIGTLNAQVAIFGSAFAPQFQAVGGSLDFTAGSGGFTADFSFPIDASGTVPVPIKLFQVTCSQVSGDYDDFLISFGSSMGVTLSDVTTLFSAVRIADLAAESKDDFQNELNELVSQATDFLKDTKTNQSLDQTTLLHLMTRAEELALALRKNNDCGYMQNWTFALPIANMVAEIIDFAFNNPAYFTNDDILLLTETAVRAGVIGTGAVNPALDTEMRSKLGALIGVKLDDLDSAGGGCQALIPLWIAANTVGGASQTQASTLYTKYGC